LTFRADDGGFQNRKISQVAIETKSWTQQISRGGGNHTPIFAFNSLTVSFILTQNGHVFFSMIGKDNGKTGELTGYRPLGDIAFDVKKLGSPLSAHTVGGGTVYEFFNEVFLVKSGHIQSFGEVECKQIRTFASSKWYKNVVMTMTEGFCDIHSVHPYL
jgi:hypothetical protein